MSGALTFDMHCDRCHRPKSEHGPDAECPMTPTTPTGKRLMERPYLRDHAADIFAIEQEAAAAAVAVELERLRTELHGLEDPWPVDGAEFEDDKWCRVRDVRALLADPESDR